MIKKRSPVYNLEGYRIRLVDYKIVEKGSIDYAEGGRIVIDKCSRLHKFPLEKIGFFKGGFP